MKTPGLNGGKLSGFFLKPWKTSMNGDQMFYSSSHFHHMLRLERKRAERSKKPFLLMLLDLSGLDNGQRNGCTLEKLKDVLASSSRDTDIRGWYEHGEIIGAIFTEMVSVDELSIETIFQKLNTTIDDTLDADLAKKINISLHPIAPSPVLQLLQPHIPDKKREEEKRQAGNCFSNPLIYNESFVC